ncbi:MAG: T9SS type A sorting domain-containing protein [Bacteroidetes bacterium]|nr:T9SS type A sorting domain-containing protein [Bacteroidota bacterium]
MNKHWVGLYLNTGAPGNPSYIGTQTHFGNKWNAPSLSGFGGINMTPPQYIQQSRFDVDGTLGSSYYPTVLPTSWFRDTSGTTYYCSTSLVCSNPPPSLPDTAITRLIAEGVFDSEEISEEARALAEEYLYGELANDSSLWQSDSAYIAFMIENQGEPVSYLYNAEEYMRAAYSYDTTLLALLDSVDQLITSLTDSIENRDRWHENNPELDVDSMVTVWTDRVNFLNQTATNINLQREGIISNNLENAELQNDYVVGDIVPYANNSYINEREIAYIESGNNVEEVTNYYSEILSIAQQCPYTGGPAVERARTLIAMVNDSVFYDDVNTCLQVGVYKQTPNDSLKQGNGNAFILIPNPARETVQVALIGDFSDGVCKLNINNAIGELVISQEMNCKDASIDIDISKLNQGIYSVKVTTGNVSLIQKLTIVR